MSKIVRKINQNVVWICWKLFIPDEKVIWSFLTLIAKNKLDEKGTLSLISIRVPFLKNVPFLMITKIIIVSGIIGIALSVHIHTGLQI